MTPTFTDFFKSFYYSNTYVPAVDLSDKALSKDLLENEDRETAMRAQQLISDVSVKTILSEPLSYDPRTIQMKNIVLGTHGFNLLSSKVFMTEYGPAVLPFYSVIEHEDLKGWVIKSGAERVPKDQFLNGPSNDKQEMAFFTQEESILRIEMAKRVAKVAKEANIEVIIPKKKLVAYANIDGVKEVSKKYCVVCEKINILSVADTVQTIMNMGPDQQKEVARKITTIAKKAGLVDTSFDNIRLTPEGKLAFIDTEPAGLMVAKKPGLWNNLFGAKGASVEKCARIGLYKLMFETTKGARGTARMDEPVAIEPRLGHFFDQVKHEYDKISPPPLSKWKIALSVVSLGLIPLINAIVALVKTHLTKKTFEKAQSIDAKYGAQPYSQEYQAERLPFTRQFFALIEGVPFDRAAAVHTSA